MSESITRTSQRKLEAQRRRKSRFKKTVAIIVSLLLLITGGAAFAVWKLQSNIDTEPLNSASGQPDRPPVDVDVDPMNILILGTDTRKGNEEFGSEEQSSGYGAADVMILLHLSEDKKHATAVSFPRDLIANVPSCKIPGTDEYSAPVEGGQLNASLKDNGPGCTVAAISDLTGLDIDHMMLADFNAVTELSNVIGGVEVCVTEPVADEKSGLNIPAGVSEVQGEQALAFLRTRAAFGDGGDVGRIKAQQSFMASLARKLVSEDTLSDVPKVYSIAEAISKNLTIDEELNDISKLAGLANRARTIQPENIQLITLPTEPWVYDTNRLQMIEDQAALIFEDIEADRPVKIEEEATDPATEEATDPATEEATDEPTEEPTEEAVNPENALVPVDIINRSGVDNRGAEVEEVLTALGYEQTLVGEPSSELPATEIFYTYGWKDYALALAKEIGVDPTNVQYSVDAVTVTLSIGEDFTEGEKAKAPEGLDESLNGQTAKQVTCQAVNQ